MPIRREDAIVLSFASACLFCATLGYAAASWVHDADTEGLPIALFVTALSVGASAAASRGAPGADRNEDAS